MAEISYFFNSQYADGSYDRSYDATDFAKYFSTFVGNGILYNTSMPLQVTHNSGYELTIKKGIAFIDGYRYELEEDMNIDINANLAGSLRTDVIAITLDLSAREIKVQVRQGATSLLPINNGTVHELVIATVEVPVGAASLSQSGIKDRRPDNDYCGFVTGLIDQIDTTNLFAQFESEFTDWFIDIQNRLSTADVAMLQAQIDTINDNMLDKAYPVGSIYLSVNNEDPETLFGGSWERIKDRFLLSAGDTYSGGATGGAATHTLSSTEMPSHTHTFTGSPANTGNQSANHTHSIPALSGAAASAGSHSHRISNGYYGNVQGGSGWTVPNLNTYGSGGPSDLVNSAGAHTHSVSTSPNTTGNQSANHYHSVTAKGSNSNTGGGGAHNNMPPYLVVHVWKRIE